MINGAHFIIYSNNAEADKAFFRDVLKFNHVDAGHGWLIFGLPPSELAVHPSSDSAHHEMYLMVDDINTFIKEMQAQQVVCSAIQEERWGKLTMLTLPGGGQLGIYEPAHPRP